MRLLLCADPMSPREPDAAFAVETEVILAGGLPFALLDFEALTAGRADQALRRSSSEDLGLVVYRGWMLPVAAYEALASAIEARGGALINDPGAYAAAHHLPGIYHLLDGRTPRTVWLAGSAPFDMEDVRDAIAVFGSDPLIVKDFVKSRKHEWADACFIRSASDGAEVERVVTNFVSRQGDELAGGLVFRAFEALESVGTHPRGGFPKGREYRLFYLDGDLLASGRYWDDVDYHDDVPLGEFADIARSIPSRFFSMDVARTVDGRWIVIEVGDGQVSGLPEAFDVAGFYAHLSARLR